MMTRLNKLTPYLLFVALLLILAPPAFLRATIGQGRDEGEKGLQFRLSEGKESAQPKPTPGAAAPAAPLPENFSQSLFRRLPSIKSTADDEKDFVVRERSLPPPRAGKIIDEPFPANKTLKTPDANSSTNLEILRFAPEGPVDLAPHLSVTFSQPMVAVTSNEDLSAAQVPVKLAPQPKGKWRWVGTKTLLFEPENRFPMATNYAAEIPAGTKSAVGGVLAETKRWTFATPPPKMKSSYPTGNSEPRNPLFFVEFDQRINAEAVLKRISLNSGNRQWPLRVATADEIKAHEEVSELASKALKESWLAFRVNETGDRVLPAETSFFVNLGSGIPSAEGPRVAPNSQLFSFRTYGSLRVVDHYCGPGSLRENCPPSANWSVRFSNPLSDDFDQGKVRVEPELAGLKAIHSYGENLSIQGYPRPRTTYKVTLDASIKDVYGQTLGKNVMLTFNTGPMPLGLNVPGDGFVVLDPAGRKSISIYSVNHESLKVGLYAVAPEDFGRFMGAMRARFSYQRSSKEPQPFPEIGRRIFSDVIKIGAKQDEIIETPIDVLPALNNGLGHALLIVEPTGNVIAPDGPQFDATWIQSTNIGLDAFVDHTQLLGWATSLKDGKPIEGVQFAFLEEAPSGGSIAGTAAKTGADGLAKIALPDTDTRKVLVARQEGDSALLPENTYWWGEGVGWRKRALKDDLAWHVFDDRGIYRPGEEVHIKGWIRRIGAGPIGDVGSANGVVTQVSYTLKDSQGNKVSEGMMRLNALGGFDASFKLPPTVNLGFANLVLKAESQKDLVESREYSHGFQIQEFRRPEYEVKATASEGPHIVGGHANLTVTAKYYAGGPLSDSEVEWRVDSMPTNYTPPNRGDFTFGKWIPWWVRDNDNDGGDMEEFDGKTDASGKHHLRIDFDSVNPPRSMIIAALATVEDINRQSLSASTEIIVHPAELYVGLRSPRLFVQRGEPLIVEALVVDIDGKSVANREIRMRASRLEWIYEKGEWRERESEPQECIVKSAVDVVTCRFETKEGGEYRITASIIDDRERRNESELTLWVAGGKRPPERNLAQEKVELIPNRKDYRAGETSEILIQSPFAPAEGVVTLRRSGLVSSDRFTMNSTSHTLRIPINDGYSPDIHVQVDLVGAAPRTDDEGKPQEQLPKRPAFASGELKLSIPPASRTLAVTATPRDKVLEPGGVTFVDVEVRDAAGNLVKGSDVTVVVVDEAVLALTNYQLADPLKSFYRERDADVRDHHLRSSVLLENPNDLIGQIGRSVERLQTLARISKGVAGGAMDFSMANEASETLMVTAGAPDAQIRTRLNFNALATFAASTPTDVNGRATVRVKLPDNLTRYRVMAVVAAGDKQFGMAESSITARLPLMVRPSAPRFLNFGDRFELPVVVQNQTDVSMKVDVAVRASNAQLLSSEFHLQAERQSNREQNPPKGGTPNAGRRITVPANDRIEIRFPATTDRPGTARFQIVASSGKWSDAAEISLPVWTPATTEAFATYGEVDEGAIIQPVKAPSDAIKQFGGLDITTSSTQLQSLTDAVLYLTKYPYECSEQVSSRILAIAALRDVLSAFEAKGLPPAKELIAAVDRDIKRLESLQNEDGGFGFWRRDDENEWPYLGIHAAHALQRAKAKGFAVPPETLKRSHKYLRDIEKHIPSFYGVDATRALIAYALYVRNLTGDRDAAKARMLIAGAGGVEKLPLESLGWLLPVLSGEVNSKAEIAAIRRQLNNRAEETTGAAHFTTSYSAGAHLMLHSDRRADAVILESLIVDDPQSDLIPKIVRGLLAHRKQGRWENTQENAFVLLALDRYFATYEKVAPDFIARAWLGDAYTGGQAFKGRTTESRQINVPMSFLMKQSGAQNLLLSKEGAGRLYYRIGMQYAPASLQLKPTDYGFTVARVYEAIDNPNDVRREEDGTWRIKAGAQVRVRLTMVAPARRYHVALVDPMPAGFEAMNPELATTGNIPQDPTDKSSGYWHWRQWFEHQNMRDERVEAFTSLLWEGVYNYSYVTRATTPGVFIVPPPKAEEMYHPETFGRGATDRVVVE